MRLTLRTLLAYLDNTLDEGDAELVLKLLELGRQRRLADEALLGCFTEMPGLGDGDLFLTRPGEQQVQLRLRGALLSDLLFEERFHHDGTGSRGSHLLNTFDGIGESAAAHHNRAFQVKSCKIAA